jgi:hypothetical protein
MSDGVRILERVKHMTQVSQIIMVQSGFRQFVCEFSVYDASNKIDNIFWQGLSQN